MKTLHLSIITVLVISIMVTTNVFAQNNTTLTENMTISRHPAHVVYPAVNVTKFMSITENSTEFKEKVNGYDHYSLATVILKPESENTGNATLEYNLAYSLYKNPNEYCSYDKELVVTLNVQLKVIGVTEYSLNDIPSGYPLPPISCLMNYVPSKVVDYNKLVGTIPWSPPLEQTNYGILAENVSCINGLVLVLKTEDGSPACVWPNTAQKLIERGWATNVPQPNPMTILKNDAGIVTLGNQTYYFETPNYTQSAYVNPVQVSFHDVVFTLFPSGFRGGLPGWGCGGSYYWTDAKFSEGTSELLHIFVASQRCAVPPPTIDVSIHTNPQAGLTFYDGKMKLLISTSVTNSTGTELSASFLPCDTPYPQTGTGVAVLYMHMNSIGKLCVRYYNGNDFPASISEIRFADPNNNDQNATDITIWNNLANNTISKGNSTIVYWIKTGNQTGVYGLTVSSCIWTPFEVVYDNNTRIVASNFPFLGVTVSCPVTLYGSQIVSTTGIGVKYIPYP